MERECRTCGGTYRGLVCHKCHPRGSGELAQLRAAARTETMTPAPLFGEATVTGLPAASYNHCNDAEGTPGAAPLRDDLK